MSLEGACRVIAVLSTIFKDLCQAEADSCTVNRGQHNLNILLFDSICIVQGFQCRLDVSRSILVGRVVDICNNATE